MSRDGRPETQRPPAASCPVCGKVRYLSRADAKRAARRQGRRCRAYHCGDFWHLADYQPAAKVAFYREQEKT
jgi:hypothetical protein